LLLLLLLLLLQDRVPAAAATACVASFRSCCRQCRWWRLWRDWRASAACQQRPQQLPLCVVKVGSCLGAQLLQPHLTRCRGHGVLLLLLVGVLVMLTGAAVQAQPRRAQRLLELVCATSWCVACA
jgi:hypothetical protein